MMTFDQSVYDSIPSDLKGPIGAINITIMLDVPLDSSQELLIRDIEELVNNYANHQLYMHIVSISSTLLDKSRLLSIVLSPSYREDKPVEDVGVYH